MRTTLRSLGRDPAMVAGVVLTFALAIGANAAMYGLVTRLMLPAPPGVSNPETLARTAMTTSFPALREVAARTRVVREAAAVRDLELIVGRGEDASAASAIAASGNYFSVLGARPQLGRFFAAEDDQLPSGNAVVVLSHSYWRKHFGANASAIGTTLTVEGQPFTVIGVARPDFSGDAMSSVDLFVPISAAFRSREPGWWMNDQIRLVSIVARLHPDVTPEMAAGALQLDMESLIPARVRASTQARLAAWLLGVAFMVLLISVANVGTLLLLRALRKRRDIAVRMALGASRRRLAAQLTTESLVLAMVGGTVGILLSGWIAETVRATLMPTLAPSDRLVDPGILWITVLLSLAAGLLAGLAPIALISARRLTADLTGTGTLGAIGRSRMQRVLIGVQVALCTMLVIGAGVFVRSLDRVRAQDLGYSVSRLLLVQLDFREPIGGARQDAVHHDVVARLRALDGVTAASVVQAMPFGNFHVPPISIPGLDEPPTIDGQPPFLYAATAEYLRLMDVRPVQGRLFTAEDERGPLVVLVNETFAQRVWPGQNALGKCVRAGHDPALDEPSMIASAALPCRTVVGVVRDSRARSLRPVGREAALMQYYVPFAQVPKFPFAPDPSEVNGIIVGTRGEPAQMATAVQRVIQGGAGTPLYARVRPYQELLDPQLRPWKLGATLFVAFGALALVIAAVGLFGVISYVTSQRTREIGLRLALGGSAGSVSRSVVLQAVRMVAIGVAAGVAGALAAGPRMQDLLFETTPHDASILLLAAVTLLGVAVAAAALPAWRASRVSPMVALRVD